MNRPLRTGTAGWSLRREHGEQFGAGATQLARYATRFNAVEINSSFYRPHRPQTYARWAAAVPPDFRFAVKMPKRITHDMRLAGAEDALGNFLGQCGALGAKLGPLLAQLPPSLGFERGLAEKFFAALRGRFDGAVACEPRHASWLRVPGDGGHGFHGMMGRYSR